MKKILIVDDNSEQSSTVQTNIELELQKNGTQYEVVAIFPFDKPESYSEFIIQNEVCVVILDEKLNDQAGPNGTHVDYLGHHLVSLLRKGNKDLPICTITNYANDADVQSVYSEYDLVINRKEFYEHPEKFVPIMVRAAEKFVERNSGDLSEFNKLTAEVAGGNKDPQLIEKLKALQVKLELPFTDFDDRKTWLAAYEAEIKELEVLKEKLNNKINGQ